MIRLAPRRPTSTRQRYVVTARSSLGTATFALALTVLPGWVVDVTADGLDDQGGLDAICFSTPAGGCSLRAAIATAGAHGPGRQLVLLGAGTFAIGGTMPDIKGDIVIAGQGATVTKVRPTTVHPNFGMAQLASPYTLELVRAAFDDFGMRDGGVVSAIGGTLIVDACTFDNNTSAGSGGVFFISNGATARIGRSTFTNNLSSGGCCSGWGGVIDGEDAGTTITVTQSTVTGNTAAWGSFSHITTGTTLRLENSTLYGNTSTIAGTLATPGGIYTLVNDTIVGNTNTNSTPDSAGIYLYSAPCHYTVSNTIIAGNTDIDGALHDCNRNDLSTSLTSNGGNIFDDDAWNCGIYFTAPGDRLSLAPGLVAGPPVDNGGVTGTILPAPGSPAIDTGQAADCPAIDQRGMPRPAGACDVGAVELP